MRGSVDSADDDRADDLGEGGYSCSAFVSRNSSQPVRAELTAGPGLLVAAERRQRVERAAVHLHLAGPQPAGDRAAPRSGSPDHTPPERP